MLKGNAGVAVRRRVCATVPSFPVHSTSAIRRRCPQIRATVHLPQFVLFWNPRSRLRISVGLGFRFRPTVPLRRAPRAVAVVIERAELYPRRVLLPSVVFQRCCSAIAHPLSPVWMRARSRSSSRCPFWNPRDGADPCVVEGTALPLATDPRFGAHWLALDAAIPPTEVKGT